MPALDMPLEQLRNYQGIDPRPDDFDSYWAEGLKELDSCQLHTERTRVDSKASFCEQHDLWFNSVGGARIYAKLLIPNAPSGAALLRFHGYTGNSGDWADGFAWAAQGFVVASLDCRGQGGHSQDPGGHVGNTQHGHIVRGLIDESPKSLYYRGAFLDTVQLARQVSDLDCVDSNRIACIGASQGGALAIACASLMPGISKCVSIYPFLSDYRRVWEMDLDVGAYGELRDFFRRFDPRHERIDKWFSRLGYIDVRHLAPRIKAECLCMATLLDDVCPPSTQFAAFNAIESAKRVEVYPDYGHEGLPGMWDLAFDFLSDL